MTPLRRRIFALLMLPVVAGLCGLGVWQIKRLGWKRALIHQVETRLAAPPVAAPGPSAWPAITAADAYERVTAAGRYDLTKTVFVQAVTELGGGDWVLTPLATSSGFTVLVNRGFVPADMRQGWHETDPGPVRITGLLRITEPHGGFLRRNDPADGRWYSRDVAAIAAQERLGAVAPYFIDADAAGAKSWPRGGLTVVAFPNNHLQYALTWFGMAALLLVAVARVGLGRRRTGSEAVLF